MDDPIKIIYKYKNNNRRYQYHIYIYVGDVEKDIMNILEKIKNLNLYDTFTSLSEKDYSKLVKKYGEFWYTKFFNTHHINSTIVTVRKTASNKNELIKKLGKDWYNKHIEEHKIVKDIFYSYSALVRNEKERKMAKKIVKNEAPVVDDDADIDYETEKKEKLSKLYESLDLDRQTGGAEEDYQGDDEDVDDADNDLDDYADMYGQSFDEEVDEDLKEIEDIYKGADVEPDEDVLKTSDLIQKALKTENLIKKSEQNLIEFDTSKDTSIHEENIKNVFQKHYVTSQYIFKDDTVKTVKNRITCSIKNNKKFGDNSYLIPSRMYLWSEYFFEDKINRVMIGQKWMRKNELLNIDIEPNSNLRVYEELRGNLKLLRDNIKRYGSKIKREDDDYAILYDYDNYFTNNEFYMIDIYNELGINYDGDQEYIRNLADVYLRVYFPRISPDDFKYIIQYLTGEKKVEEGKLVTSFETINNDLIMENEIMKVVENVRAGSKDYENIFKENYITQSVIHVNLRYDKTKKIDLFRIFNEFVVDKKYPFVQFQTIEGNIIYKFNEDEIKSYHEEHKSVDLLAKWFENEPYGLNFKVKILDKGYDRFMAINLNETGRIEYKTQWKEVDMATVKDIQKTYEYVKGLVEKINKEKNRISFDIPIDKEFRYAFINTIQKFELPDKFVINHNDLSEFSRFFYPYVSLVIEPRKRQSKSQKDDDKGKYGTYLRYKRVSKYENQARIEQRILYFMRNYDHTDQTLAAEISKQFNITESRAYEEIDKVKSKYSNIKKSRKILKKLENIPKYKPPGIGVDIQGKSRDMYKIRIVGARDKEQLDRIISFLAVLMHLYIETYLYKKPERQELKDKLSKLTNIARRRNKVDEIVNYDREIRSVKQMTQIDKTRIGFKPEKGQNQWTRSCQNSGDDKKRRPQQYTAANMEELLKRGYSYNKNTGMYEKVASVKKGKKKKDYLLRAVKLQDYDDKGDPTGNDIYYACSPEENGEHFYIGFLTRSSNPFGYCMPCCFKKDPMTSKNKEKREYFMKCIGKLKDDTNGEAKKETKATGDKLYILQDTNKIQEGRFGFLPKYLDFFMNYALNKTKKIKHHYLLISKTGYFFKYGSVQDINPFLNAMSSLLDMEPNDLIEKLCNVLKKDKKNKIFTAINNGDIRTQFGTRDNFINFLKEGFNLNYEIIGHFLTIPGVVSDKGLNIIGFDKISKVVKYSFEKERIKEDFIPMCLNYEENENIYDTNRDNLFIIKENRNYYPIVMVKKETETQKNVDVIRSFKYEAKDTNIVHHLADFVVKNCFEGFIEDIGHRNTSITAKHMVNILNNSKNPEFLPKVQIIDTRNRCKYIMTDNNTIIPVKPSGSIYNMDIIEDIDSVIDSFDNTYSRLKKISKIVQTKPIGVHYENKKGDKVTVLSIVTETYDIVPTKPDVQTLSKLRSLGLKAEDEPLYDKIDKEIKKGRSNYKIDKRITEVNYDKYFNESYQLFRLHLSEFINQEDMKHIRSKIVKIIENKKEDKKNKINEIKKLLYKLSSKELYDLFDKTFNKILKDQKGGKYDRFIHIIDKIPDISNYEISNNRDLCTVHENKQQCSVSPHCHWSKTTCYLSLTKDMLVTFINKVSEELVQNDIKASEILQINEYFVSDIVDYSKFTERPGQRIIKSSGVSINRIMEEVFGKDNIPKIGKRRLVKGEIANFEQLNTDNPLKDMKEFYIQNIIENNLSIFRSYINGFYWIKHSYYDPESRNLGYYSDIQTELVNYFRSLVIDWLYDNKDSEQIKPIRKYIESSKKENKLDDFISKLTNELATITNGVVELFVLSKINKDIPVYVYDDESRIMYLFHDGLVYDAESGNDFADKKYEMYNNLKMKKNSVNLRFSFITGRSSPDEIEIIYYK